jgi:thiol-disulfide isomerase/thioredoxin
MMKKMVLLLLVFSLTMSVNVPAVERMVLGENFTNTSCGPCYNADPTINRLANQYADRFAVIRYHVNWPSAGDPFYLFNTIENMARRSFYGVNAVPNMQIDGVDRGYTYTQYETYLQQAMAIPSPLEVSITGVYNGVSRSGEIAIEVRAMDVISYNNLKFQCVLTETGIQYNAPNGIRVHNQTMRDMIPDANGESFTISQGDTVTFNRSFHVDPQINQDSCFIICFIQDSSTRTVLQSGKIQLPDITIYEGWGWLVGCVTDAHTGQGISAVVTVANRNPVILGECDNDGNYSMLVPADSQWQLVCEFPNSNYYLPDTAYVTVPENDTVVQDFELRRPAISVEMMPHNYPIFVSPGSYFSYIGILENTTTEPQTFDFWIMLHSDLFGFYGPITRYNNITLQPEQRVINFNVRQDIPAYAPLGEYSYIAVVGDLPQDIVYWDSLLFTVIPPGSGDNETWNVSSWFDDMPETGLPDEVSLNSNFPNPFNACTNIGFSLPAAGDVTLEVFNMLGQKVATLADGHFEAGDHNVAWDASEYASGVYFYKLAVGDKVLTKRMTLLK